MAVITCYTGTDTAGQKYQYFICDTFADLPVNLVYQHDTAFVLATGRIYHRKGGAWSDEVITTFVNVDVAGVNVNGGGIFNGDVSVIDNKGVILRAPNGHRFRLVVSNLGMISGVDLDA